MIDVSQLEVKCKTCGGHGGITQPESYKSLPLPCPTCETRGYVLTDLGRQLIDFVKRHSNPGPYYKSNNV